MDTHTHATTESPRRHVSRGGTAFITSREVADLTGLSEMTLWRMRRRGEMPEPVRLSPGRIAWRRGVIEQWLAERA